MKIDLNEQMNYQNGKLLKAEEVARTLCISRSFAYQLMRSGQIPTIRLGRSMRVRPQDLENYLEQNLQKGQY